MNTPAVPKPNDPAKDTAAMAEGPELEMVMLGSTVDGDPDTGRNEGFLGDSATRTSWFKKRTVAAAGLLLLSVVGTARLFRARETGIKAGGPVTAMTLPIEIIPPPLRNRAFHKLRRFMQGDGFVDGVEFATMTMSHDEWHDMFEVLDAGGEVRWAVERHGRTWTGDVKDVISDGEGDSWFVENSPECNGETLYKWRLLNGFMPPLDKIDFSVHCCGDEGVDGACTLSCDCFALEQLATAYEWEDEPISDDMYLNDAFWFEMDAESSTYNCVVVQGKPLEECCPPGSLDPNEDGLCTLLSCVDTADITIKDSCSCQDIKRACLHMGIFDDLPVCEHIDTCCGASTEGLDFNQCIGQLIPDKDNCTAIYGAVHHAFDCGEGTAEDTRHRQLSGKCLGRRHQRRALSETDLVSDMKQHGTEICLEEHYTLAVQAIGSHLVVAALPQEGSTCPGVVADSGYTKDIIARGQSVIVEGVPVLTKHLTVMDPGSVIDEDLDSMLFLGNVASLKAFHHAIQNARTSASKDSAIHGVVGNCATFILDVMADLHVDFGKKETLTKIVDFVAKALMASEDKDDIVAGIKKKINNPAVKAWVDLRGDKYAIKKYIKTFLKNYESD